MWVHGCLGPMMTIACFLPYTQERMRALEALRLELDSRRRTVGELVGG